MSTASLKVVLILSVICLAGCSKYTRGLFWENKVASTPYETPMMLNLDEWRDDQLTYSWLGQATVLINVYGTVIMTDPVLHDRIAPPEIFDNQFGIRRLVRLPIEVEELPKVDLALVSHPHYDHLDLVSLRTLAERDSLFIVPYRNTELLDAEFDAIELDWFARREQAYSTGDITVTAFRVEHYGYLEWGDRDEKRGFNGYLLHTTNNDRYVAFFGDTSYSRYRDEDGEILAKPQSVDWRKKLPDEVVRNGIDLCIIPIGDYYYYWNHISPRNAVRLAGELHCKQLLPIHYATFLLTPSDVDITEPKKELMRVLSEQRLHDLVECRSPDYVTRYPDIGVSCVLP